MDEKEIQSLQREVAQAESKLANQELHLRFLVELVLVCGHVWEEGEKALNIEQTARKMNPCLKFGQHMAVDQNERDPILG